MDMDKRQLVTSANDIKRFNSDINIPTKMLTIDHCYLTADYLGVCAIYSVFSSHFGAADFAFVKFGNLCGICFDFDDLAITK